MQHGRIALKLFFLIAISLFSVNAMAQIQANISVVQQGNETGSVGSYAVTLNLNGESFDYPVEVYTYLSQTGLDTATEGEDYDFYVDEGSGYLYFEPGGSLTQVISLNVIDDSEPEGQEYATIAIEDVYVNCDCNQFGEPGPNDEVTIFIEDNDDIATFTVYKYFDDENPVGVTINLNCADATVVSNNLIASVGSPAVFSLVDVGEFNYCDATETGAPSGYDVYEGNCQERSAPWESSNSCYIYNYYIPVTASISQQSDAAEPSQDGAFQVSVSGSPPYGGMVVNFSVSGTAVEGQDFSDMGDTVFIPYGSTSQQLPVDVIDDTEYEDPETVIVTLTPDELGNSCESQGVQSTNSSKRKTGTEQVCEAYSLGSTIEATVIIEDDEVPIVGIETEEDAAEPDTRGTFKVSLNVPAPEGGLTIGLVVNGTADPGVDYVALPRQVTFAAGETSQTLIVTPIDDELVEGTEQVKVFLSSGEGYEVSGSKSPANMNIIDDDAAGNLSLSIAATSSTSEPSGTGVFTVSLSEASAAAVSVSFSLGGTATAGMDFVTPSSPVVIAAGSTSATIDIVVIDDDEEEGAETVSATLSTDSGIPITGDPTATITIEDDDASAMAGIQVNPTSGLMTTEDGGTAQFSVVLNTEPSATVSVAMESSDTTEGTISPTSLEFNSSNWNMARTVTVTGVADTEADGDIAYTIILNPAVSSDSNYSGIDPADVSVTNKDVVAPAGGAEFSSPAYTVNESDGSASIGVRRTGGSNGSLTVTFSTDDNASGNTADEGDDYASTTTDVTWADGDSSEKFVSVEVFQNEDKDDSGTESVQLKLSGATIDDDFATLEIISEPSGPPINPEDLPPNQQQVAKVINESCPQGNNSPDFQALCTAMVVTDSSLGESLKETTADDAAVVRSSGMQTANIQVTAVDGRIGTLRGGGGAGFSASGFSVGMGELSLNSSLVKNFISAFDQNTPEFMVAHANANDDDNFIDDFGRWGAWISGRVIFGDKDATTSQLGYDFDTAGLTFGLDYRFSDTMVAGVAVGYANTDADLGADDGKMETKGYSVSLYGTWFPKDNFFMGGSIGYGGNDYDQTRNVRYSIARPVTNNPAINALPDWAFDVDQTMQADYDGSQFSAAISGGWDFNKNGWTFGPTFRIDYVSVKTDGYDERLISSNSGNVAQFGWAVHIDDQEYESLQPAIGFEFSRAVSRSWGVIIPQGYIDLVSEIKDSGTLVTGRYLGDTNRVPFALQTDDFEETFVRAGLGFGMVLKNNKSAFFMVDGDLGRDLLKTYYINAGFRWQF